MIVEKALGCFPEHLLSSWLDDEFFVIAEEIKKSLHEFTVLDNLEFLKFGKTGGELFTLLKDKGLKFKSELVGNQALVVIVNKFFFDSCKFIVDEFILFILEFVEVFSKPFFIGDVEGHSVVSIDDQLFIFEFVPSVVEFLSSFEDKASLILSEVSILAESIDAYGEFELLSDERSCFKLWPNFIFWVPGLSVTKFFLFLCSLRFIEFGFILLLLLDFYFDCSPVGDG